MRTVITDSTGRTWKRALNPAHNAAGLWYSSAGTMSTLPEIQAFYGPLTVKDQSRPSSFTLEEIRKYIVPTHNNERTAR